MLECSRMELLIFILWVLLVFGVPLMLIVAAFIGYRKNADTVASVGAFALGLIVHVAVVAATFLLIFALIFGAAHTRPSDNELHLTSNLVFISVEVLYALFWVSMSTFIAGRAKPWPLPVPNS